MKVMGEVMVYFFKEFFMLKRLLFLLVLLAFCSPLLSAEVADNVVVTATTSPNEKIIVPVSTLNPLKENWADISASGSYTGQLAHDKTEEITGSSKWQASASCNGVIFKNNQSSFNWQGGFTFNFSVKSNSAAKYTISITLSVRNAILRS